MVEPIVRLAPVFILAPPLGLGAHLAACLDRHSAFAALPATQLFCADTPRELKRRWGDRMAGHDHGLIRAIAGLTLGGEDDGTALAASDWLADRRDLKAGAIMADLASAVAPRQLVDASFLYPVDEGALERIGNDCPDARFIHLLRHPALVLPDPQRAAARGANLWLRPHLAVHTFLAERDPLSWVRLRVEWLARDPATQLAGLLQWLGAAAGPIDVAALTDPARRFGFARPGPALAPFGVDPGLLADPALTTLFDAPLAPDLDETAWAEAGFDEETRAFARLFGYS